MVLRSGLEQFPKVLAGSVVPRNDKVGALNAHFGLILRALKRYLVHYEVLRVWKTLRLRTYEHQLANLRGITQRKAKSNVAAMRTGHESGLGNLAILKECRNVIGFEIRLLRSWRAAVPSPVLTNRMELFAKGGPYIIPDSRVDHSIMEQDHSFRSTATLLVIEARSINLHKR